ncbi:MAG: hypothetical protein Q4F80_08360 [bacterium]|nr:hypothetical protein [bacterium]
MKKFLLFLLLLFMPASFAYEIYDAAWCRQNGGTIEFDFDYNINFNCLTNDIKAVPYIKNVYNIVCIPYFSSILKNEEPLFLKLVSDQENNGKTMFDEYNWKITEDELVRYI